MQGSQKRPLLEERKRRWLKRKRQRTSFRWSWQVLMSGVTLHVMGKPKARTKVKAKVKLNLQVEKVTSVRGRLVVIVHQDFWNSSITWRLSSRWMLEWKTKSLPRGTTLWISRWLSGLHRAGNVARRLVVWLVTQYGSIIPTHTTTKTTIEKEWTSKAKKLTSDL